MPRIRRSSSPRKVDGQHGRPQKTGMFVAIKDDLQAAFLEFCGTILFLLIGLGGIQAVAEESAIGPQSSTVEKVLYISAVMGLSLLMSAWLFFRVTGGLFNPNVSLALLITGVIKPVRFVFFCVAQLLGGVCAAALVDGLTPGDLTSNTYLASNVTVARGVFIEMFITAALCLTVLMLGAEKHQATPFAPVGVGLTLFACHLFAVYYTGASMNTARSFGPAAVTGFQDPHHWVYWVGPGLGSLLAGGFYSLLKYFRYWRLNPGQDSTDVEDTPGAAPSAAEKEAGLANGGVDGRGGSVHASRGQNRDLEAQA